MRVGDGLDARVRGRGDDEEWGSELGGELGDLTQVSHGDVSDAPSEWDRSRSVVKLGHTEPTASPASSARSLILFGSYFPGSPSTSTASYPRRARRSIDVPMSSPWKPMTLYE